MHIIKKTTKKWWHNSMYKSKNLYNCNDSSGFEFRKISAKLIFFHLLGYFTFTIEIILWCRYICFLLIYWLQKYLFISHTNQNVKESSTKWLKLKIYKWWNSQTRIAFVLIKIKLPYIHANISTVNDIKIRSLFFLYYRHRLAMNYFTF